MKNDQQQNEEQSNEQGKSNNHCNQNYSSNLDWKNRYIRMQKRLKSLLKAAQKKDVQLQTELLALQQKVMQLQERNMNKNHQSKRVQAIKQTTIKSLQPETNKIIQMHGIELAKLKSQHSDSLQFAKIEYETMLQTETKRLQREQQERIEKIKESIIEQMKVQKEKYQEDICRLSDGLNQANQKIEKLLTEKNNYKAQDKSQINMDVSKRQENSKDNKFAQIIERMKNDHDQELKLIRQKVTAEKEEEFLRISHLETQKMKLQAEQQFKVQAIEMQNKHQRDIDELIVKLSKGGKSDSLKMKSAAFNLKSKQLNLQIEQKEKIISDLAFKLDTEQTASAIIARRLASAESLSSQKDDIIRSLNMQLLDISYYDKGNLEQDEKQLKLNTCNGNEDQLTKLKNQIRMVQIQHSEYIKEMEKKHKQQLDSLGCKLACLQAHYARITGDEKVAGMSDDFIDKAAVIQ